MFHGSAFYSLELLGGGFLRVCSNKFMPQKSSVLRVFWIFRPVIFLTYVFPKEYSGFQVLTTISDFNRHWSR